MNEEKNFHISDLFANDDHSFTLGIRDKDGIERLYEVRIRVNSHGELVGLKSEKRS